MLWSGQRHWSTAVRGHEIRLISLPCILTYFLSQMSPMRPFWYPLKNCCWWGQQHNLTFLFTLVDITIKQYWEHDFRKKFQLRNKSWTARCVFYSLYYKVNVGRHGRRWYRQRGDACDGLRAGRHANWPGSRPKQSQEEAFWALCLV